MQRCDLIPRIGALFPSGLCVSCVDTRKCVKCVKCARNLGPYLYAGNETRCNTCIRKTSQQGSGMTNKSLGGAVIDKIRTGDNANRAHL